MTSQDLIPSQVLHNLSTFTWHLNPLQCPGLWKGKSTLSRAVYTSDL